jgi:hypothetical protein
MNTRGLKHTDKRDVEEIFDLYWSDGFRENLQTKLDGYLANDPVLQGQHFTLVVAENEGEVVGVAAYRIAPEHMRAYCTTEQS